LSTATRSRVARGAFTAVLALGLTAGTALAVGAPASAAPASAGFIAAPNSMVGVETQIVISAPKAVGQTVTIGAQVGGFSSTMQTTIGSNGYGSVTWTPGAPGTWVFNGLGTIASLGSTTASVVAQPTYTVLMAQNNVQQGVSNNLEAIVVAPLGNLHPTGTVTLQTGGAGNAISSAPLTGGLSNSLSTAIIPWTPSSSGSIAIQATYTSDNGAFTGSTSPISTPNSSTAATPLAIRWPANLYVGQPTLLQGVVGNGYPPGTVAFTWNTTGISGSIPTTNGVASFQWAPPSGGINTISAAYTGATGSPNSLVWSNGTSSQIVNVQPTRPTDNLTVDPPGQPAWNIAQPITMQAGSTVTLAGTSQSGTAVIFSEQGNCVIAGAVLTALSPGQCQVTAQSPGTAAIKPGSETYTITVTAPPKRPRR
jgi:hypothetical protein